MSIPNNWGDWRPNLTPHTGNLQATDLIECTMIVGGNPVNTAITGAQIIAAASGGSVAWGAITGTLSAQTDLQTALNGKFDNPTGTTADYIDGTGGLQVFPTLTSADKMVTVGRNATGSTLYAGTIIYISGSTGNRPNYVKAQANSEATSAGTFGVIQADIPNNSDGNAVTIGTLSNLDTRSVATHPFTTDTLVDGDTIYLSPTTAGYVTRVKPSAPNHLVYIGKVVRTSPTNGTIVYRIQNGYELDEIHDVAISSVANNDLIQYDSATSLWKNRSLSTAGIQPTLTSGTSIKTVNSTSLLGSGDVAVQPTLVSGTNIKTINGTTLLGSGNITISGGSSNPSIISSSYADGTIITGTTAETVSQSLLIPANTFTNGALEVIARATKVGVLGSLKVRFYKNTTNSLTGATLIAYPSFESATVLYSFNTRTFRINTNILSGITATANFNFDFTGATTPLSSIAFNTSVDNYILFVIQLANIADSANISMARLTKHA